MLNAFRMYVAVPLSTKASNGFPLPFPSRGVYIVPHHLSVYAWLSLLFPPPFASVHGGLLLI